MSWGGCLTGFLATDCLLTLSGRRASLGRRLLAAEDCRVTLACLVAAADPLNGLPATDGDLTTTGLSFVLDGLPSTAVAAPGALGAVGWTVVDRTGLGFWDGRDAADGGVFTAAGPTFGDDLSLVAAAAPGSFGAMGRTNLGFRDGFCSTLPVEGRFAALVLTLITLGRRRSFLAVGGVASLTGPGAGSLAGGDGFLWSFWSAGDGLRAVRAFVVTLP